MFSVWIELVVCSLSAVHGHTAERPVHKYTGWVDKTLCWLVAVFSTTTTTTTPAPVTEDNVVVDRPVIIST